tara:strand:+ start:6528 stop:9395 length:2868 start_codon:yes stop_codon:yes gene_type:complete
LSKKSAPIAIDRFQVLQIKKKFVAINRSRVERASQSLDSRHRDLVDLLPLLFHVNHPTLPGYVSQSTPCGVSHYKPDSLQLKQAKKYSRSFRYQPLNQRNNPILALFVMGSMGSLGQTRSSDLDIWVCYQPQLSTDAIQELQQKCERITQWAKQQHLELCFFPMDNEEFKSGGRAPLSEESSGGTQHQLLLDEFYRSALHLAGRYPLWWFVPSEHEANYDSYCQKLLGQRYLKSDEIIDLGGLPGISSYEFTTAAVWQMYKAIQSPYKSMLKLFLLEVYAQKQPETNLLAHQFKQRVEAGITDIDQLDPYVMLLHLLEDYLQQQGSMKRLEMIRRCFYFKVAQTLSRPSDRISWQRDLLRQQVDRWRWRDDQLRHLDSRRSWKTSKVISERQRLIGSLLNSYRLLSEFVRQNQSPSTRLQTEIAILGRKLYAAYERKAGKIEWINPDISPDISEAQLSFSSSQDDELVSWRVFDHEPSQASSSNMPLKSSRSLAELITWAYCNQILIETTKAQLATASAQRTDRYSLQPLYRALEQWQPLPLTPLSQKNYASKPIAKSLLLIVNIESNQKPRIDSDEKVVDVFNVGESALSLVNSIHLICLNSWNEILVSSPKPQQQLSLTIEHQQDLDGLPDLITELLSMIPQSAEGAWPQLSVFVRNSTHGEQINQRISHLLQQLQQCFHTPNQAKTSRFILEYAGRLHLWQYAPQIQHQCFDRVEHLQNYLSQPQADASPIIMESLSLQHSPLRAIATLPVSSAIQVGYRLLSQKSKEPQAEIYVLDERGSLFVERLPFRDQQSLLRPLHHFIRSAIGRLCLIDQHRQHFGVYPVEFYRFDPVDGSADWLARRVDIATDLKNLNFFNIQAIIVSSTDQIMEFSFYCDDQEFHSLDYGNKIYRRVASYILARRRQAERYPCYITDLDLSRLDSMGSNSAKQVCDYLTIKNKLERELNHALQTL